MVSVNELLMRQSLASSQVPDFCTGCVHVGIASTTSPSGVGYVATEFRGSSLRDDGGAVLAFTLAFLGVEGGEDAAGLLARRFVCDRSDDCDVGEVVRGARHPVATVGAVLSALILGGAEGVPDLKGSLAVWG